MFRQLNEINRMQLLGKNCSKGREVEKYSGFILNLFFLNP